MVSEVKREGGPESGPFEAAAAGPVVGPVPAAAGQCAFVQGGRGRNEQRATPVTMSLLNERQWRLFYSGNRGAIVQWLQMLSGWRYEKFRFPYMTDAEVMQWVHSHPTYSILYSIERNVLAWPNDTTI